MLTAYASAALARLVHAQIAAAALNEDANTVATSAASAATSDEHRTSHKGEHDGTTQ